MRTEGISTLVRVWYKEGKGDKIWRTVSQVKWSRSQGLREE